MWQVTCIADRRPRRPIIQRRFQADVHFPLQHYVTDRVSGSALQVSDGGHERTVQW